MLTQLPISFARQVNDEIVIFDPNSTFHFSMDGLVSHRDFLLANIADSSDPLQRFLRCYCGIDPAIPIRRTQSLNRYGFNIEVLLQIIPEGGSWVDLGAFGHDALRIKQLKPPSLMRLFAHPGGVLSRDRAGFHYLLEGDAEETVAIDTLDIEHEPLPIETGTIDAVSAFEIIEHFKFGPQLFVSECNRILKQDGALVLSTPNICSAKAMVHAIEGHSPCDCREYHSVHGRIHPLEYDYSQIHSLFTQNGFSFESLISVSFSPLPEQQIFAIRLNQEFYARFPDSTHNVHPGEHWFAILRKCESIKQFTYPTCLYEDGGANHNVSATLNRSQASIAEDLPGYEDPKKQGSVKLFAPPGHFYSPIVDPVEAGRHLSSKHSHSVPDEIPGISIDRTEMMRTWKSLLPFLTTVPFSGPRVAHFRYHFENPSYSWGDGSILYAMLRFHRPKRLIEIGSGWSSACTLDTVERYLEGACDVTIIDPFPQLLRGIVGDGVANFRVIELPVQQVPEATFEILESGDILFIDSTHVLRTGSDVCFELFDVLPRLASGVLVHFHDIFWPFEYPTQWVIDENRSWNEIYALRAFLSHNAAWRIVLFNDYLAKRERAMIESSYPQFMLNSGGALWLQRR